ncbi:UDP-N-acetylmuramate dehydrogenase [Patescibacteria group bacterium]|nr:UDP-N-acetylmuramate dehydrogenase [Patescibacteria group bacterium]
MINELKKIDSTVKENYPFKELTTFKIGGPAGYFANVDNEELLIKLLKFCQENNLKYLLIGEGSNLLISDRGFDGLAIKLNFKRIEFDDQSVEASADFLLNQLVALSVSRSLSGLESMIGIPGTIGGAVAGNAGAYGSEIANVFEKAEVLDKNLEKKILAKSDMQFSYRDSLIKKNGYIILKVFLKLHQGNREESIKLMNKYALDRYQKHPHLPSAGSTFKNIILTDELVQKLKEKDYEISKKFYEYKKIPAAWLIENLGLRGYKIGYAQVSEKHANHLVNTGQATADDMVQLISYVKTKVRNELGIQLEEEVRYVGF